MSQRALFGVEPIGVTDAKPFYVSSPRRSEEQDSLFDAEQFLPLAACRNWVGDFYEELTAQLMGGQRCKTDACCLVCPDIKLSTDHFAEVKSIGCGNAAMVYENRLEKDLAWTRETGARLTYVLWNHCARFHEGLSVAEIRKYLSLTTRSVTFVPLEIFASRMKAGPVMTLNANHKARGYGSLGYRLRLKAFQDKEFGGKTLPLSAYGFPIAPVFRYIATEAK